MVFRFLILKQGVALNRMSTLVVHSLQAKLHFLHCGCRDYLANQASNYPLVAQCRCLPPIQWLILGRGSGGPPAAPPPYFKSKLRPKEPNKLRPQRGKQNFFSPPPPRFSNSLDNCHPAPLSEGLDPPLLFVR